MVDRMELRQPSAPESESLLRPDQRNNAFPYRRSEQLAYGQQQNEPVRLTPAWEGTNLPNDTLNLKGVGMELAPPRDKWNLIFLTLLLHGIGTLAPWNMFITAKDYFVKHKLAGSSFDGHFLDYLGASFQIPNLIFSWVNCFVPIGGDLTRRIVWSLSIEIVMFVLTIVLAMVDSSEWVTAFFWITIISSIVLATFNAVFQNSVYGIAARLPGRYTGAVVLGSNISGTLAALLDWLSTGVISNARTGAVYFFIGGLLILLICFDTYFALPLNRFYRYHEKLNERSTLTSDGAVSNKSKPRYGKILKIIWPQLFNVFFTFFVTLSLFPSVSSDIRPSEADFIISEHNFARITCFLTFNFTAMLGNVTASMVTFPGPKWLTLFVLLRFVFFPFFLLCNYQPLNIERVLPVLIHSDWVYWVGSALFGWSSGHGSSLGMMYVSRDVPPEWQGTAGMIGAATLVTGITSGILFAWVMPLIVSASFWTVLS